MKTGMVTQIRVNTKDCLAILDLMEIIGVNPYDGRSFAQCTSMALASMIATMRKSGVLQEEEDGFQYMNRMAVFQEQKNTKKKHNAMQAIYGRIQHGMEAPTLTPGYIEKENQYKGGVRSEGIDSLSADLTEEDKDRLFQEYQGLNEKMNNPDVDPEDKMRYRELGKMLGYE